MLQHSVGPDGESSDRIVQPVGPVKESPFAAITISEQKLVPAYHLRNFRMDKIKIDSSFIHGMLSAKEDAGIVRALVGLAQGLGITVAAEGIQDYAQQASLLRTGCEQGQGHLYGDIISAERTPDVLEADTVSLQVAKA